MNNEALHIGNLRRDSPGLFGNLQSKFPAELYRFEEAYSIAALGGGLDERGVDREPGASYNPRPARIASILLSETNFADCPTIEAGILSCASIQLSAHVTARFPEAIMLLTKLPRLSSSPEPPPIGSISVAAALAIDRIRHLHMTALSKEQQRCEAIELAQPLSPHLQAPQFDRLRSVLSSAVERLQRQRRE